MKTDIKNAGECPTECSHPNVSDFPSQNIPKDKLKKIEELQGDFKKILYCGHCNSVWIEYIQDPNQLLRGKVWFSLLRVEDMQTMKEKWLI